MKSFEQFEIEGKKYSIIGAYPVHEFLHRFIDGEFPGTAAYIVKTTKSNRPEVPIFYMTVVSQMGTLFHYYASDTEIVVYERMPQIKYPERECGNCKHFCTHYVHADDNVGLSILNHGHCVGRNRVFNRERGDRPKDDKCFQWNAESVAIMELLEGGTDNG